MTLSDTGTEVGVVPDVFYDIWDSVIFDFIRHSEGSEGDDFIWAPAETTRLRAMPAAT